ncbi:MAG: ABC transporter transmembrane domain-containing protein [Bacteroidia bacterium]|nr:ABC transporter transmembrane domain-containing protein [Bacteroidia bacterium]
MAKKNSIKENLPKATLNKENLQKGLRLFDYIHDKKLEFITGMSLLLISSGIGLVFPMISGSLFGFFGQSKPDASELLQGLYRTGFVLLIILLAQGIISFGRVYFFSRVTEHLLSEIRKKVFSTLLRKKMEYYLATTSQELNARLSADITLVGETFTIHMAEFIRQIIVGLGGLILIFIYTPAQMALWFLVIIPPIIIISLVFGRKIRKRSRELQDKISDLNTYSGELLSGISFVKMFVTEFSESERYANMANEVQKAGISFGIFRGSFFAFIITCVFGTIFFVLFLMVKMKIQGQMEAEQFGRFLMLSLFVAGSLGGLPEQLASIQRALGAADRLFQYIDEPEEKNSGKFSIDGISENIVFDHVDFYYPARPDVKVLDRVCLEIEKGKITALVGPSGSGKSTVVSLLLRFFEPSAGTIKYGSTTIQDIDLYSWRKNIGVVPQENFLFSGTIRQNITYGCTGANEEDIWLACRKAYADEFIRKFPDGLETKVGERGIQLSGGQRQRIAIARAILKNPDFLILDEATSNLDSESEHYIKLALQELMKNRTTLIIAHRLSTIRNADKIILLNKGKVVQQGSHAQLMADENGMYFHFVSLQEQKQTGAYNL